MHYSNKRVGLSYISDKVNLSDIYNEEIIVDKSTGEVLVKTPEFGNIISYNYHTRLSNHISKLSTMAFEHCLMGLNIYQVDTDSISYPNSNDAMNKNLVDSGIKIEHGGHAVIISIDMDSVMLAEKVISNTLITNATVEYRVISEYLGVEKEVYSGNMSIRDINDHVFFFKDKNDTIRVETLVITDSGDTSIRNIVNSILIGVDRNNSYPLSGIVVLNEATNEQRIDEEFDETGIVIGGIIAHTGETIILDRNDYTYIITPGGES